MCVFYSRVDEILMEAANPEGHHNPSLVEGDFFPLIEVESVDGEAAEVVQSPLSPKISAPSPAKIHRSRISWADEQLSGELLEDLAEFYLPKTTRAVSLAVPIPQATATIAQPTAIVRERINGDGLQYHFYPSQRPSQRLLEARTTAKRGGGVPFAPQPGMTERIPTLFSVLLPKKPAISVEGRKRIAVVQSDLPLAPAIGSGSSNNFLHIFSPPTPS